VSAVLACELLLPPSLRLLGYAGHLDMIG